MSSHNVARARGEATAQWVALLPRPVALASRTACEHAIVPDRSAAKRVALLPRPAIGVWHDKRFRTKYPPGGTRRCSLSGEGLSAYPKRSAPQMRNSRDMRGQAASLCEVTCSPLRQGRFASKTPMIPQLGCTVVQAPYARVHDFLGKLPQDDAASCPLRRSELPRAVGGPAPAAAASKRKLGRRPELSRAVGGPAPAAETSKQTSGRCPRRSCAAGGPAPAALISKGVVLQTRESWRSATFATGGAKAARTPVASYMYRM